MNQLQGFIGTIGEKFNPAAYSPKPLAHSLRRGTPCATIE